MRTAKWSRVATAAFFVALVALGFLLHGSYGLSWDAVNSHINGRVSLAYVLHGDPTLWAFSERYYGVWFEMPFVLLEDLLELSKQETYFLRHLLTFLFFVFGVYVFYRLCLKRWESSRFALLGAVFLVLSPRIFADAFYNSRDLPTMVLFIVAIFTLSRFSEKPDLLRAMTHALACAALITIRLPGLFVPALTFCIIGLCLFIHKDMRKNWRNMVIVMAVYCALMAGLTILFWPFLWQHPVSHFLEALTDMSRFSRQINLQVLYLGQFSKASDLPWHYLPVWVAITTPLLSLVLLLVGTFSACRRFLKRFVPEFRAHLLDLVVLAWFFGPLVAVIGLDSIVYDGWRHLYFVYPALIYIALLGLDAVMQFSKKLRPKGGNELRVTLSVLVCFHLFIVAWFMIKNHPYQNMYFNSLVGNMESARRNFDFDYWGLSFRDGLEYIAKTDSGSAIPIFFAGGPADSFLLLDDEEQRFDILTESEILKAKYILSNYRFQRYDALPHHWEIYTVKVNGTSIMSVYRTP
jgi:hypothetical protein